MPIVKSKMFFVDCGSYPFQILVYFGQDRQRLINKINKHIPEDEAKEFIESTFHSGKAFMFSSGQMVLWMGELPMTDDTDEVYAYQIGYITNKIYSKL